MGAIIYKPHCGKCGAIINQQVRYRNMKIEVTKNLLSYIDIKPNRCACCGEVFHTMEISMPKEVLTFVEEESCENDDYYKGAQEEY